ncbi:glycosyltransferase [Candidatus Bathyarchaeota archaeon]|nr:glycosyltransferase [Candidatus Bathyarchaeota archaeon]
MKKMRVLFVCFKPLQTELGGGQTYIHAISHGLARLGVDVYVLGLKERRRSMQKIFKYNQKIVRLYEAGSYSGNYLRDFLKLPEFIKFYRYLARRSDIVQVNGLIDRFIAKCLGCFTRRQKIVFCIDGDVERSLRYQRAHQPFIRALLLLIWKIEMWHTRYVIAKPSLARRKGWVGIHVPVSIR